MEAVTSARTNSRKNRNADHIATPVHRQAVHPVCPRLVRFRGATLVRTHVIILHLVPASSLLAGDLVLFPHGLGGGQRGLERTNF